MAQSTSSSSAQSTLPTIQLLCMRKHESEAFHAAVEKLFPDLASKTTMQTHNCTLNFLPEELRFDAVVSPANSYGRLDGAFDDAISLAYSPDGDYDWTTRKAQKVLYEQWKGFAPPGTCTIVPLADEDCESEAEAQRTLPWGTRYILLCPTMRVPHDVKWDREVVYECIWSLLCAIDNHNRASKASGNKGDEIKSILMTPLATGVGRVSAQRWAEQCVLALKHWDEASSKPEKWGSLEWEPIYEDHEEVVKTYYDDL